MHNKWTFSNVSEKWVHDVYDTKEEAIEEALNHFDVFLIGQLSEYHVDMYKVINREKYDFSKDEEKRNTH